MTVRIVIGAILPLQVASFVTYLLVGGDGPIGAAAGLTSALAIVAYLCMLPVILLVTVVEGLWTWIKIRKINAEQDNHQV